VVLVTGFVAWLAAVLIGALASPAAGHGPSGVIAGAAASAVAAALAGPLPQVALTALYLTPARSDNAPSAAIT
jgi:membrane-associated phospholipid phosphatase